MSLWLIISGAVLITFLATIAIVIGCVLRLSSRIDDFEELNDRGDADAICESAQTKNVPKESNVV